MKSKAKHKELRGKMQYEIFIHIVYGIRVFNVKYRIFAQILLKTTKHEKSDFHSCDGISYASRI